MLEINWERDRRNKNPDKYLVSSSSNENRLQAFLVGWRMYLKKPIEGRLDTVSWRRLGMLYASVLGNIPENQRREIYRLLLSQFISVGGGKSWPDEQKEEALRVLGEM